MRSTLLEEAPIDRRVHRAQHHARFGALRLRLELLVAAVALAGATGHRGSQVHVLRGGRLARATANASRPASPISSGVCHFHRSGQRSTRGSGSSPKQSMAAVACGASPGRFIRNAHSSVTGFDAPAQPISAFSRPGARISAAVCPGATGCARSPRAQAAAARRWRCADARATARAASQPRPRAGGKALHCRENQAAAADPRSQAPSTLARRAPSTAT